MKNWIYVKNKTKKWVGPVKISTKDGKLFYAIRAGRLITINSDHAVLVNSEGKIKPCKGENKVSVPVAGGTQPEVSVPAGGGEKPEVSAPIGGGVQPEVSAPAGGGEMPEVSVPDDGGEMPEVLVLIGGGVHPEVSALAET